MMLSIITINRNNATGLERTMRSVLTQTSNNFEYIVVDGDSTDGSVDVIKSFASEFGDRLKSKSEPDSGIYNAMNKGIKMVSGDYIQILNSGDCLAAEDVTGKMLQELDKEGRPSILYGNMIKVFPDGHRFTDKGFAGKDITLFGMYSGSLNHNPAYIRKDLFEKYGMYDENLKVVSDWKWYLQAIILGGERPIYTNLDVTLFDMTGISETNKSLHNAEKRKELEALIPFPVLADYDRYATAMGQFDRLQRHPWAYRMTWFLDRCLFKWEKWQRKRKGVVSK